MQSCAIVVFCVLAAVSYGVRPPRPRAISVWKACLPQLASFIWLTESREPATITFVRRILVIWRTALLSLGGCIMDACHLKRFTWLCALLGFAARKISGSLPTKRRTLSRMAAQRRKTPSRRTSSLQRKAWRVQLPK